MSIKSSVLNGKIPEDLCIYDAHAHIHEGQITSNYVHQLPMDKSIELSEKIGIKKMVASNLQSLWGDPIGGNKRLFDLCEQYPEKLYGYFYYSPHLPEESLKQLQTYRNHPGFIGIKIHPGCDGVSIATGRYDKIFAYALENNMIVITHCNDANPENDTYMFYRVMKLFPRLKLILAHVGGFLGGSIAAVDLANKYENIYLDINGMYYSHMWLENLMEQAPQERVIFGTDQTFNDPGITVGRVALSDISDKQKSMIFYENYARLVNDKQRFPY